MILNENKNELIIILCSVFICIAVVFFIFTSGKLKNKVETAPADEIKKIQTTSKLDDIDQIEKDLNETDVSNVDKELKNVEQELNLSL